MGPGVPERARPAPAAAKGRRTAAHAAAAGLAWHGARAADRHQRRDKDNARAALPAGPCAACDLCGRAPPGGVAEQAAEAFEALWLAAPAPDG
eukprot:gene19963-57803_t